MWVCMYLYVCVCMYVVVLCVCGHSSSEHKPEVTDPPLLRSENSADLTPEAEDDALEAWELSERKELEGGGPGGGGGPPEVGAEGAAVLLEGVDASPP